MQLELPNQTVHLWSLPSSDTKSSALAVLQRYLHQKPEIQTGPHGKPFISNATLQFNISHTHGYALMAVLRNQPIGIDVEYTGRKIDDYLAIAKRFFTANEYHAITLSSNPRAAFFRCWTRKEAFIKATGMGLSFGLQNVEVSVEEPAVLLNIQGDAVATWTMQDISIDQTDYCAALVVMGKVVQIEMRL